MKTIIDYTEEIKAYVDYKAGTSLVQIPSVVGDTFTYNGTQQGPTITGLDTTKCTVTNATKINSGTYTLTIALNDTSKMMWDDLTTADKTYAYTINKANGAITLSKNSVSLDTSTPSDTVTFSGNTGAVTVSSSDATIATASVSNDTITITAVASGTATITVDVASSDNYNSTSTTISVEATLGPALVPWSTGTDDEIAAMVNGYYNGSLTLEEIQSVWSIGDEREVTLSEMSATGVSESHVAQRVKFVLMNWGGKTLADNTTCLAIVGQKNSLSEVGYMNSSSTNAGGWTNSARRAWCNNVYKESIPSDFRLLFKLYKNLSGTGGGSSSGTQQTTDYFALPAEIEVFGSTTYSVTGEGSQFKYYETSANRIKKLTEGGSTYTWRERSPISGNTTNFCTVNGSGNATNTSATSTRGLAPFGCI